MEYNSFYGGRRGASFIIVKQYETIKAMKDAFSKGGDYKTVNYGEYVLINTRNKNNKDNGKVYRRGYGYDNDMGGAIYVGQIVGPAGPAPHLEIDTTDSISRKSQQEGYADRFKSGEYTVENSSLIPGKTVDSTTGENQYNDKITWAAYSMRDSNATDTTAYIGFQIPYLVVDYTVELTQPYGNDGPTRGTVNRIDDGSHPFYEEWAFTFPNGIKGDSVKNLRTMVANNSIEPYANKAEDIANHREVLVYDWYDYSQSAQGTHKTYYLGSIEDIEGVNITEEGLITISYSYKDDEQYQLRLPSTVTIDTGTTEGSGSQKVVIQYSNGTEVEIGNPLNYIMDTVIDTRYHLLAYFSDPQRRAALTNPATYDGKTDWADLGYIGNGTGVGAVAGRENDTGVSAVAATMPTYSAWFIVEDDGGN